MSFYTDLYQLWGDNVRSLGWGSKQSQECRFSILLKQDINEKDTILDVGCGFADLKSFLTRYGYDNQYVAVEKEEQFRNAALEKYTDIDIFPSIEETYCNNYDWVFASGIFCFTSSEDIWLLNTSSNIKDLYSMCRKGVVVNFLYGENKNTQMHYTNLSEISEIINNIEAKGFNIYSNYKNNDISLALYK